MGLLSNAVRGVEHSLNSLHVYTKLVKVGFRREDAHQISLAYEPFYRILDDDVIVPVLLGLRKYKL